MAAVTASAARVYQASFNSRPNATLAFTGGLLNALGDAVAQLCQNTVSRKEHGPRQDYDVLRTLRFFSYGFAISPLLGRWNVFLERKFPLRPPGSTGKISMKALVKRVLSDQVIVAPIGLVAFIGSMGVMERRTRDQIHEKYHDMFAQTLIANWQVWPILQFINFRFMPLPYRIPFQSTCGVFWTLYLSIVNSREDEKLDHDTAMRETLG